jgi:DNA-binding response OmpR family regulator
MLLEWNGVDLLTESHLRFSAPNWGLAEKGYALLRNNLQWDEKMKLMLKATTPLGCSPPNTMEEWNPPQHAYPSNGEILASLIACTLEIAIRCQENYNGADKITTMYSPCDQQALMDAISYLGWKASQFNEKAEKANRMRVDGFYAQIILERICHPEVPSTPFLHRNLQHCNAVSSQDMHPSAIQTAQWNDAGTSAFLPDPCREIESTLGSPNPAQLDWTFCQASSEIILTGGRKVHLTYNERGVLRKLASSKVPLQRTELANELINGEGKRERVGEIIRRLRQKFSGYPSLIETRTKGGRDNRGGYVIEEPNIKSWLLAHVPSPPTIDSTDCRINPVQQDWIFNNNKGVLKSSKKKINLTCTQSLIFNALVSANGQAIKLDAIAKQIGHNKDRTVSVYEPLRQLRLKLTYRGGKNLIRTHGKNGYSVAIERVKVESNSDSASEAVESNLSDNLNPDQLCLFYNPVNQRISEVKVSEADPNAPSLDLSTEIDSPNDRTYPAQQGWIVNKDKGKQWWVSSMEAVCKPSETECLLLRALASNKGTIVTMDTLEEVLGKEKNIFIM